MVNPMASVLGQTQPGHHGSDDIHGCRQRRPHDGRHLPLLEHCHHQRPAHVPLVHVARHQARHAARHSVDGARQAPRPRLLEHLLCRPVGPWEAELLRWADLAQPLGVECGGLAELLAVAQDVVGEEGEGRDEVEGLELAGGAQPHDLLHRKGVLAEAVVALHERLAVDETRVEDQVDPLAQLSEEVLSQVVGLEPQVPPRHVARHDHQPTLVLVLPDARFLARLTHLPQTLLVAVGLHQAMHRQPLLGLQQRHGEEPAHC
mmetsp:Transcript_15483/g.36858  ORF Transcript_15483/g.36858 Transcript_15483/m.36858 type:complete len:261 (+) Transcript_15483:1386-2168(+)